MESKISERDPFIVQFFTSREVEAKDLVDFMEFHSDSHVSSLTAVKKGIVY